MSEGFSIRGRAVSGLLHHLLQYSYATLYHLRAVAFPFRRFHALVIRRIRFLRSDEPETFVKRINVSVCLDREHLEVAEQHSHVGAEKAGR